MITYISPSTIVYICTIWVLVFLMLVFIPSRVLAQENNNIATENIVVNGKVHYPANLTECVEELKRTLPTTGNILEEFKSHSIEITNDYHFTLGLWIRNNWIRHGDGVLMDYFEKMGIYHPDDMSGIILVSLWRDLHSVPLDLKEQVEECKKFYAHNQPVVRERRSLPSDIWNSPLSLSNGNIVKLFNFKGKTIILLLFSDDIFSPDAITTLDLLKDKFSKWNVSIVGFCYGNSLKDQQLCANYKSATFPLIAVEPEFIGKIQEALVCPGNLTFPQVILIGKDGNMIVRFNGWSGDAASKKELCDEIQRVLN